MAQFRYAVQWIIRRLLFQRKEHQGVSAQVATKSVFFIPIQEGKIL